MPRSPWRRIPFASIAAGSMAQPIRLDRMRHRQLDISHGCQNHTVLPYASAPYVLRDVKRSRVASPCIHLPRRRCRVHHIPPRVRDDRDPPLLSRRDGAEKAADLGTKESEIFCAPGWMTQIGLKLFYKTPFARNDTGSLSEGGAC
jgi:hypothetical protein